MKKLPRLILIVAALAVVFFLGRCTWQHFAGAASAEKKPDPTAQVQVAPLARKTIAQKITAYGSVVAQPGKTHSLSIAYEIRVRHTLIAPGQFVQEGEPLVEVEASSAAQLLLQQAKNAAESTRRELAQAQERFRLKLATNQEIGTAEKIARDAEAQLASLQRAGAGGDNLLRSDMVGIVGKVNVQDGQIIAVGSPLVELVAEGEIEVKLGVEAEDLAAVRPDQPVSIFPVNNPDQSEVKGKVRLITRRVDPMTRLVDIYVALPAGTKLLLDGFVRCEFERRAENVLVVPRSAILPNEKDGFELFTIEKDRAKKHAVKVGIQNATEAEVSSPELHEGDQVVSLGNYELQDGMAVEVPKVK
ncbi:MAG: efflux RND transporter periplasmic adaptor subunit [Verrucomicrobiota bacterium]|nr:efflux RND transporter periplasmic adaptor subunit [Verrucomicrobiota bacterium]